MIRRDRDPIDDDAAGFRLTMEPVRAANAETSLPTTLAIGLVILAISILKPWAWGSPEPSPQVALATVAPVPVTPIPTEDRTVEGLAAPICLGTGAWRVTSLETWRTQDVRVWRAIEPIEGVRGPLDPAIPTVPIVAIQLVALGWCAPGFGPDMPVGPADVAAWSVRDHVATEIELRQVRPVDGVTPIAALYVPMTLCPEQSICATLLPKPEPRPWGNEQVVFRYTDAGSGRVVWFAANISILPPSASPGPGAAVTP